MSSAAVATKRNQPAPTLNTQKKTLVPPALSKPVVQRPVASTSSATTSITGKKRAAEGEDPTNDDDESPVGVETIRSMGLDMDQSNEGSTSVAREAVERTKKRTRRQAQPAQALNVIAPSVETVAVLAQAGQHQVPCGREAPTGTYGWKTIPFSEG
jgi:hypothetical protein